MKSHSDMVVKHRVPDKDDMTINWKVIVDGRKFVLRYQIGTRTVYKIVRPDHVGIHHSAETYFAMLPDTEKAVALAASISGELPPAAIFFNGGAGS